MSEAPSLTADICRVADVRDLLLAATAVVEDTRGNRYIDRASIDANLEAVLTLVRLAAGNVDGALESLHVLDNYVLVEVETAQ